MEILIIVVVFVLGYCMGAQHEIQEHMKTLKSFESVLDRDVIAMTEMADALKKMERH